MSDGAYAHRACSYCNGTGVSGTTAGGLWHHAEIPEPIECKATGIRMSDRLIYDPDVSDESPIFKGTWITVAHVISCIVDGDSWSDILRNYPELTEDDIRVAVGYSIDKGVDHA